LGPQAVDERVDEGREVVAGWKHVWEDTRVLGGEFGGPVNSFIASNAAVFSSVQFTYLLPFLIIES